MKLAVVKPDHLGDLVLSSPAVRAMALSHPGLNLFVGSRCFDLARSLFPGVEIRALDMPHLVKARATATSAPDFRSFDAVALLRRDGIMSPSWAALRMDRFVMFEDSHDTHQTVLDYGVAREFTPAYDIDALFYGRRAYDVAARARSEPARVGLSIGSGFYANSWPMVRWIELGRALRRQGRDVVIIHGPAEDAPAAILKDNIRASRTLRGGSDFAAFFDEVAELDLVIASDGGTAHLCSVAAPILSIFGPSPVRRYAPTGAGNRVLTQKLGCSPCCQYAERLVNGCMSVECMSGISAADVLAAMEDRVGPGEAGTERWVRRGLLMIKGASSTGLKAALRSREFEMELWVTR